MQWSEGSTGMQHTRGSCIQHVALGPVQPPLLQPPATYDNDSDNDKLDSSELDGQED